MHRDIKLQFDSLHKLYVDVALTCTKADKEAPEPQPKLAESRAEKTVLPSSGQKRL